MNPTTGDINQLETLLKVAAEQAHEIILTQGRPLMPTWVLIDHQGNSHILGTPWRNGAEKMMYRLAITQTVKKLRVRAFSFLSECWIRKQKEGTPYVEPRLAADRREAVIAMASDGKDTQWRQWEMVRDHNEKVIKLVPVDCTGGKEGWIADLLKENAQR